MADYYTLLTNAGIAYETTCKAAGVPIKLSQISVGDGGGAVYNPAATDTALKREVWRGPLNALFQDEKNPSWLLAEVTIPPEVGGWYVREAGLWTDTGILYAIVKYPESFKPVLATSGSGKEFYIRSIFETSNAALVTLLIDDTVVKATRAWVSSYVADELAKLDRKQSVRVATTANIVLSGAQTLDGIAVVAGDRVLVKSQASAKENGIYVAANDAWIRAKDADASVKVTSGLSVPVEEGATLADTTWQLVTDGAIVLGTTALTFQNVTQGFAPINSPALLGNPTTPTPGLFSSDKSIATTEYVQRALGSYAGQTNYAGDTVLTAADVGKLSILTTAATVTLPDWTTVPPGGLLTIVSGGGAPVTVKARSGESLGTQSGQNGPFTISSATFAVFRRLLQAPGWSLDAGDASLKYSPMMSGAYWTTQPQFSNTKALATTEFVQKAIGSFSDSVAIAGGNVTLTAAHIGARIEMYAAGTLTLPKASLVPRGASILITTSTGSGAVYLAVQAGDSIALNNVAVAAPYAMSSGSDLYLVSDGVMWRGHASLECLRTSQLFAANFGADANQVLPSGWTFKIGHASTIGATGTVQVTFPVAFPTACMFVGAIYAGGSSAVNPALCQSGVPTRTGFTGYLTNVAGNNAAVTAGGYNWLAIGY